MGPTKYKFRRVFRSMIEEAGRNVNSGTVLDAACANGKFAVFFKPPSWFYYVGVDYNNHLFYAEQQKSIKNRDFFCVDLINDPLPRSPKNCYGFDLLVSTHTLAHIPPESRPEVLSKFIAAVKLGGWLIVQIDKTDKISADILYSNLEIVRAVSYGGVLHFLIDRFVPRKLNESYIGQFCNWLLSYIDFGPEAYKDTIILARK